MSEVDFDRIVDAVRKEIALSGVRSLAGVAGIRLTGPKAAIGTARPAARKPMNRVRRVGEGQKRYR